MHRGVRRLCDVAIANNGSSTEAQQPTAAQHKCTETHQTRRLNGVLEVFLSQNSLKSKYSTCREFFTLRLRIHKRNICVSQSDFFWSTEVDQKSCMADHLSGLNIFFILHILKKQIVPSGARVVPASWFSYLVMRDGDEFLSSTHFVR